MRWTMRVGVGDFILECCDLRFLWRCRMRSLRFFDIRCSLRRFKFLYLVDVLLLEFKASQRNATSLAFLLEVGDLQLAPVDHRHGWHAKGRRISVMRSV